MSNPSTVVEWMVYPRPGTSLMDGVWLCSIRRGHLVFVDFLKLENGKWYEPATSRPLPPQEIVYAVSFVPRAASF